MDSKFIYVGAELWLDTEYCVIQRLIKTDNDSYAICEIKFADNYVGIFRVEYCYYSLAYGPHYMLDVYSEYYIKHIYPKFKTVQSYMELQHTL